MKDLRKQITLTVVENAMIDIDNTGQERYTFNEEQFGLLIDNLVKNLALSGVSNWVAIESEEQPERVTDVMVKYKDGRKEVAFFDGDGRFYTQNDDDITDKIASWHKLP
jgi:hypothetical protein